MKEFNELEWSRKMRRANTRNLGFWLLTFSLVTAPALGQRPKTLSWLDAIDQALKANQRLAAAQEDLLSKKEDVSIAKANFLPHVGVGAGFSKAKADTFSPDSGVISASTGLVGATLTQMIYDERFFADFEIEKDLYAGQEESFRNSRYEIISGAGQAYIGVLLAEELLQLQLDNLRLTQENLEIARAQEEVGSSSLQQVLRLESQLYGNQQDVADQRSNVIVNRLALNQVRDRPAEEINTLQKLTVERDGFIFSSDGVSQVLPNEDKARLVRDYLVEMGVKNSPLIAELDREISAQRRQLKSNKRWLIPDATFNAGADAFFLRTDEGQGSQETDTGFWKLGVSIDWFPFDGGADVSRVHQAQADLRALESQRRELVSTVEQGIRASAALAIGDYLKIAMARSQAEAARQNYDLVFESYFVGEVAFLDLLDAQTQLLDANSAVTIALYNFLLDLLIVEQAIGYFPFLDSPAQVQAIVKGLESRLR